MSKKKDSASETQAAPAPVPEEPRATCCPECYISIPAFCTTCITGDDGQRRHSACHRKYEKRLAASATSPEPTALELASAETPA